MTRVFMMIGCPGAGKSTWIKNNLGEDFPVVSRDIIRCELGYCKPDEKYLGSYAEESKVTEIENARISDYLKKGISFAIDDTNLSEKYRPKTISNLRSQGAYITGVKIETDFDTCLSRRNGQIPTAVIKSLWEKVRLVSHSEFDEFIEVKE
jgi:predicted kinase